MVVAGGVAIRCAALPTSSVVVVGFSLWGSIVQVDGVHVEQRLVRVVDDVHVAVVGGFVVCVAHLLADAVADTDGGRAVVGGFVRMRFRRVT